MERLCGRPGCSDRASVVYGMRPEDLVFWIDALPDPHRPERGGVVPASRELDGDASWVDAGRSARSRLETVPPAAARPDCTFQGVSTRERARGGEQLQFVDVEEPHDDVDPAPEVVVEDDDLDVGPWTPSFDEADDLDGLLSARSPLLSRAFRTADRSVE